ncbi:MAG: hypothetical protein L6V91_02740 [Bacilli bacterium]|nr:MAG: hypothetical protein L6V91_02740 [Bacilli bacterium]
MKVLVIILFIRVILVILKGDFGDYVLFEVSVYTDRYDEFENLVMTTIDNF